MWLKIFFKTLLFCLLSAVCLTIAKADGLALNFRKYSSKDGLSSNTIFSLLKDSYGFLWVATEDGLNRFDGTNFKVYRHDKNNPYSLRANHVTALHESPDGSLWIGTNGGSLSTYDRTKDAIVNYLPSGRLGGMSAAITSVCTDEEGNIWVASYEGLYVIHRISKKVIYYDSGTKQHDKLKTPVSLCLFKDSKGRMWVGTDNGLYLYDLKRNSVKQYMHDDQKEYSIAHNMIYAITEDEKNNIWIGTREGVSMLMPDGQRFKNFRHTATDQHSISSNTVYALAIDGKQRLWIGTDEGLDILDLNTQSVQNCRPEKRNLHSLSSRSIRSILIDKEGIYWVGTYQGGLNKYDTNMSCFNLREFNPFDMHGLHAPIVTSFAEGKKGVFVGTDGGGLHLYDRGSGLLNHIELKGKRKDRTHDLSILTMEMGRDKKLWIGTYMDGLFCYDPAQGSYRHFEEGRGRSDLNHSDIFCLKEDRHGDIWIGTNGGGVNVLRLNGGQIDKFMHDLKNKDDVGRPSSNVIRAIEEDHAGKMWIGTFGAGLSVYDPLSGRFTFYNKKNSGLPSDYVLSVLEDRRGNIWVGTSGNGIGLLKNGAKRFISLSENDGLANGFIVKIVEDTSGKLWFSSNQGLSSYDMNTRKFKNFSHQVGLQSSAFVLGAGLRLADGELFFGGQNGFNHFYPGRLKTNRNIPEVVLTDLKIDNQSVLPSKNGPIRRSILSANEILLKYKQNFSIAFEALNFTIPEQNQYEYRLEGFDKGWIRAGKEHSAYYTNLDPGEYTFRVRASNNDGVWNKQGKSIKVTVAPPFWRTIYAYIAYLLLAASILLGIRQRGIKKLEMKFAIEQERLRTKQLIEQERKEAEHLRELDRMKIKFLTNLSHEFRTPISLIMGPVDNLLAQVKDTGLFSQLNLIKRNGRRLLNLVNQLLDFRKMEEQELKLRCSSGELVSFIEEISDSFNDLALRKQIDYAFYTDVKSVAATFDHDKMERILFNLLSNAFKFTPENGSVTVKLEELKEQSDLEIIWVQVSVRDSGIGIPEEAKGKIFESFVQHDVGSAILNQGTGIGLSIAREFVRMHGGMLYMESEVGKGSCFTFDVPLKRTCLLPVEPDKEQISDISDEELTVIDTEGALAKKAAADRPSVLIVEDDDDFRFYIKDNLKSLYRIFEASNGKEGWQRTLFHHPDILVCDVHMPYMNGLELAQKLKLDKRTKHIPVILLTAANTEKAQLHGLESGANDYMTKPFNSAVLHAKIKNLLTLNRTFKDTYSKQVKVVTPTPEITSEKDKFLQKILSYIDVNLTNPQLSVEALSRHLIVSRASLYNRMLEYTGMTPVEFIRSVKLDKAVTLLKRSDMNVAEIAYQTGFANPNYFTKVFKAKYHVTPSEFIHTERNMHEHLRDDVSIC
ncbi:MAG TPA: two-component regulator propeller domain-containing protein [Pseudosphingobacterium sp.]|nr:two-component regulator propeller domain-containing protein [Pseudosphingobacterium sp.]